MAEKLISPPPRQATLLIFKQFTEKNKMCLPSSILFKTKMPNTLFTAY